MTEEKGIPLLFESAKPGRDREGIPENGDISDTNDSVYMRRVQVRIP